MKHLKLLVAIAVAGVVIAIVAILHTNRPAPAATPPASIASAPFQSFVAGSGITENGRGNVSIATAVPGVVREVYVRVGDTVRTGDPLFRIDDRDVQARLRVADAEVRQAQAAAAKQQHRLAYLTRFQHLDRGAISAEMVTTARDDAADSGSAVDVARAEAARLRVELERLQVRAPRDGRVLQINVRQGEFAGDGSQPLMLLGDDTRLFLRIDVDENDAWRVKPAARAVAYLRGNPNVAIPLRFEYVEPYVAPKTALTGQATERTDLRVLQVVYSFERRGMPVYLGQQMDAFIEAEPASASPGPR